MHNRQIIQLHQMAQAGHSRVDIARTLGVHANTVTEHLAMRVSYPADVLAKIGRSPRLPTGSRMPLYSASVYLPGWPSRAKTYALVRAGVLHVEHEQRGCWRGSVVTAAALAEAAQAMLPPGLWVRSDSVALYTSAEVQRAVQGHRVDCQYWPHRHYGYIRAHHITAAARDHGVRFHASAASIHRAIRTIDLTGVATLR